MKNELLRKIPKIDELLNNPVIVDSLKHFTRFEVILNLRATIEDYRNKLLEGCMDDFNLEHVLCSYKERLKSYNMPKFKKVINATGIIIHTNLGRSVLCKKAIHNVVQIAEGYNNLEYDLELGLRGSRYSNIEDLIKKITGAEAAFVVNNNAAAVMLVLDTLCKGKEVIISRGQLVEIGGHFRVPEVIAYSGAKLVEVGTTNKTHLYDYENQINENTGILMKVHTSNYKIMGFTEEVSLEQMVQIGAKHHIPVVEDIGSGLLIDFAEYGFTYEPTVQESIKKGADVVTFSGDKMLGGPQAGIIIGKKIYIDRMKKNQLTRALRIDKLGLAALEGTLLMYSDEAAAIDKIPTLNMILSSKYIHKNRAQKLKRLLKGVGADLIINIREDYSMVGGGSMPLEKLQTYVLTVKSTKYTSVFIEKKLRTNNISIITRISNGEVIIDLRTIFDQDYHLICEAFKAFREDNL